MGEGSQMEYSPLVLIHFRYLEDFFKKKIRKLVCLKRGVGWKICRGGILEKWKWSVQQKMKVCMYAWYRFNENAWALTRPPAKCPLCQYSCPKVVQWCQDVALWCHLTSWRRAVTSRDVMTSCSGVTWRQVHDKMALCNLHKKKSENQFFSK